MNKWIGKFVIDDSATAIYFVSCRDKEAYNGIICWVYKTSWLHYIGQRFDLYLDNFKTPYSIITAPPSNKTLFDP